MINEEAYRVRAVQRAVRRKARSDSPPRPIDREEAFAIRKAQRRFLESGEPAFPNLADPVSTVSATYGVAFQEPMIGEPSTRPATFVIDRNGVLRVAHRAKEINDRPTADRILQMLDRLPPR